MICMPHVHSNISIAAKFGVINSQLYRFLRLFNSKAFFVSQMASLIVLLKNKGYPLLKRARGLLNKVKFLFGLSVFGVLQRFCIESHKWGSSCKTTGSMFSLQSFSVCFVFFSVSLLVFSPFVVDCC
jgi:hypothetical protein